MHSVSPQINGVDVHSREQAIRLFAENREDITLLLARPQMVSIEITLLCMHDSVTYSNHPGAHVLPDGAQKI